MIKINLTRKIKGKDLIKEFENIYGDKKTLKKLYENSDGDMKLEMDLEDWKYFQHHPNEVIHQKKIFYDENPNFNMDDLKIIDIIKNQKPESISKLASIMNKDVSNITKKVNKLKDEGLIELKTGPVNNIKIPSFNFDKIVIEYKN
ncbi:MAG: MarR family transcriptional regulator [Methanobrevibacter sp.]|jgi:hypothetical protein|nr:MarR family transcriptional regulator [Methanobrevibacter sp.]